MQEKLDIELEVIYALISIRLAWISITLSLKLKVNPYENYLYEGFSVEDFEHDGLVNSDGVTHHNHSPALK